jgi:solute carrier family 36 (proton-coupled amino acid transporter)
LLYKSFRDKKDPNQYIEKRRYGGAGPDDSDESGDEDDTALMDMTPVTRRKNVEDKAKSVVNKLGPVATYLTLMKGFVASAVLYLPKSFVNGGWGFSIMALVASCIITTHCAMLLIQVKEVTKSSSYTAIGLKLYGRVGKALVDLSLCLS